MLIDESTIIMGIDPGTTSGLSVSTVMNQEISVLTRIELPFVEAGDWIKENVLFPIPDVICSEAFLITPASARRGQQGITDAMGVLGVARYTAAKHKIKYVTEKSAIKRGVPDAALKHLGIYEAGQGHSNDSLRHVVYYAVNHNLLPGRVLMLGK